MQYKIESVGPVTVQIPAGGTVMLPAGGAATYQSCVMGGNGAAARLRDPREICIDRRTATKQRRVRGIQYRVVDGRRFIPYGRRIGDKVAHQELRRTAAFSYISSNDPRIRALERRKS